MTALFVPALRIMGEHLPERAELSWCRSRPEPEGRRALSPIQRCTCRADLPAAPCKCRPCAPPKPAATKLQHCGF